MKMNPDSCVRMMFTNRATIALCSQTTVELSELVLEELVTATTTPTAGAAVTAKEMIPRGGNQRMEILL